MNPYILLIFLTIHTLVNADQTYYDANSDVDSTVRALPSHANSFYVAGSANRRVYRYNYTLQTIQQVPVDYTPGHGAQIVALAISPNERYIASGSNDCTVKIADGFNMSVLCTLNHHNQIRQIVFDPTNDDVMYSVAIDDNIRKWAINNCTQISELVTSQKIYTLGISPDGNNIGYGTIDGKVGITDSSFSASTTTAGHQLAVLDILFMNAQIHLSVGQDSTFILWNGSTVVTTYLAAHRYRINNCDFFLRAEYNTSYRTITCLDEGKTFKTFRITNSSIVLFSSHGTGRNPTKWVIGKYIDGVQMHWTFAYGTGFTNHIIYDSNSGSCSPHFGQNRTESVCRFCFYMIDGCHFCDDESTCNTCSIGTYRSSNLCYKCPDQCSTCNSATNCNTCATGYYRSGNDCLAKASNGCFQFRNTNNGNCYDVGIGYYFVGQFATPCSTAHSNCLECAENNGACTTCQTGYYVNGVSCNSCAAAMPGCQVCFESTNCIVCAVAFIYIGANLQCSNCYGACLTCGTFYNECLTCNASQFRSLNGTNCECNVGYYDNSPTSFTCVLCSSVLTQCYDCTNGTVCTQCNPLYYTYVNGGLTECQLCNSKCETCEGTSTNCTSCNSATYQRTLSGSTCVCATGFVELSGSISCSPCGDIDEGCAACTNQTYCSSCQTGYFINVTSGSTQTCDPCPYYCPDCTTNITNDVVCSSCPSGTFRTLVGGMCQCDTGYFDDNETVICQQCSSAIANCVECSSRRKCTSCAVGLYSDESNSSCSGCSSLCLTCGAYYNQCTSCDPSQNRILVNGSCACDTISYEDYTTSSCVNCADVLPFCSSCQSSRLCLGCLSGYTIVDDGTCIDCSAQINGCRDCTSTTNCTDCISPFSLINGGCRCPSTQFTSNSHWGTCSDFLISGLESKLDLEWEVHQHQNNSLTIFIRFRALQLTLNQRQQDSVKVYLNDVQQTPTFDPQNNNLLQIRFNVSESMERAVVRVTFETDVFFNERLFTLTEHSHELSLTRIYIYDEMTIKTYSEMKQALTTMFYVLKWIFLALLVIGIGHYLFEVVVLIQILPIFLMLNMSLPSNLSSLLEGMLSFQVKNMIPLLQLNPQFYVLFPHLTYHYYGLYDYFVLGKLGDLLVIVLINLLTHFNEGFVRMFPKGAIRRFFYETLVRRGYAVRSLGILAFQPSFLVVCGVFLTWTTWQTMGEVMNYISIVFLFGFFMVYNFNHISNLHVAKELRNIETQNNYLGLNGQANSAYKVILMTHSIDFVLAGGLFVLQPFPYFIICLLLLVIKLALYINCDLYRNNAHFILKLMQNILLLSIYVQMMVFYLGQSHITITIPSAQLLGLATLALIMILLVLILLQKLVLKLTTSSNKVVNEEQEEKIKGVIEPKQIKNKQDDDIFNNTGFDSQFVQFFNKRPGQSLYNDEKSYNMNSTPKNNKFNEDLSLNQSIPNFSEAFSTGKDKKAKVKNLNTSKYAKHHLQLKYQANATIVDD